MRPTTFPVLNIGHRGARAFAPENTLPAFRKAAALGAQWIEFDVQLTRDQQLIIVHDDTLDRCSDVRTKFPERLDTRVRSFTLQEIQQLDAGSWFARAVSEEPRMRPRFLQSMSRNEFEQYSSAEEIALFRSGSVQHPTLAQALDCVAELGLGVNVELKASAWVLPAHGHFEADQSRGQTRSTSEPDMLVRRALELVHPYASSIPVLVSSFDHRHLVWAKRLHPELRIGVLVEQPLLDAVTYCRMLGAVSYNPGCIDPYDSVGFGSDEYRATGRLPTGTFASLRAAGMDVYVWTENDPNRMQALLVAGATGIFTDYPNRLRDLLKR